MTATETKKIENTVNVGTAFTCIFCIVFIHVEFNEENQDLHETYI